MITCLGLMAGVVTSASKQETLNKCATFLSTHKNLLNVGVNFEIDNVVYATVIDFVEDEYDFAVMFCLYDGSNGMGVA